METRTYKVYKFDELTDEGKEKAIQNLSDINVDRDWWELIDDDAKTIGLTIDGFGLDRDKHVDGSLCMSVQDSIKAIYENHGKNCETYVLAEEYEENIKNCIADDVPDMEDEYERALKEEYASILQKEYEYLTSDEAIIETIQANDYDFTEDGKID